MRTIHDNVRGRELQRDDFFELRRVHQANIQPSPPPWPTPSLTRLLTSFLTAPPQLESGIRALDIRCHPDGSTFQIYHGIVSIGISFDDVLQTVTRFLAQHPREIVLMRVHEEISTLDQEVFAQIFDTSWRDPRYAPLFWTPNSGDPALDEVRGKIVAMQDFGRGAPVYGLDCHAMNTQDDYVVSTIYDLYDKWSKIKAQVDAANAARGSAHPFFLDFLSGSTGVLPFFIASGKTVPPTDAPLLLTDRKSVV